MTADGETRIGDGETRIGDGETRIGDGETRIGDGESRRRGARGGAVRAGRRLDREQGPEPAGRAWR